ncbi:hypothetical protein IAD21_00819 [Abditibacteriota bacterium]|nr:hypothetical protein IAD21_00819 [Abditibacteriota bacterium]
MKNLLFLGLVLVLGSRVGFAQFSGSAGENAPTVGGAPTLTELAKRQPTAAETKDDGNSTFIEASLLMNVKADEYVAVFGSMSEGLTPEEASNKLDATIAGFKTSLKTLGIADDDIFVDFVSQNRIYAYKISQQAPPKAGATPNDNDSGQSNIAKEELVGFELKKNISIHFKDKLMVDQLAIAAARAQIFDLIKVDYVVKDREAIQARLQEQTMAVLKRKADSYGTALGIKLPAPTQIVSDKPSVYYPVEQYDSYTAAESESLSVPYNRDRTTVQNARKSRTTYFNPLSGNGFDVVINPTIIEPVVQFTTYIKVKYADPKKKK